MSWSESSAVATEATPSTPAVPPDDLREIVRAVRIESATRFEFAGLVVDLAAAGRSAPPLQAHDDPLVERLLGVLYPQVYCRRFGGSLVPEPPFADDEGRLAEALSHAHPGAERIDRGWVVEAVLPGGAVAARKGSVAHTFLPGEFVVPGQRGRPAAPGSPLHAALAHESWTMQPGFYFAFGSAVGDDQDDRMLVRLYWNVDHPQAPALLAEIVANFDRMEIPFRLKCPAHPSAYGRCDAMVLYLSRRHIVPGLELARRVEQAPGTVLRGETPIFTRRLAPGLAFAEDPGGAESFGTQRMRLLAEGLREAFRRDAGTEDERLAIVAEHFEANGVAWTEPWRCRADGFTYDFSFFDSRTQEAG